jgi:Flp pilus assembly pilin Flp
MQFWKVWPARWSPLLDTCGRSRIRIHTNIRKAILQAKRLCQEEEGKDSVEYTLLLVLVALAAIAAMVTLTKAFGFFLGPTATGQTTR